MSSFAGGGVPAIVVMAQLTRELFEVPGRQNVPKDLREFDSQAQVAVAGRVFTLTKVTMSLRAPPAAGAAKAS